MLRRTIVKNAVNLSNAPPLIVFFLTAKFLSLKGKTEHLRVKMEANQTELIPLRARVNECQQKFDMTNAQMSLSKFVRLS